MVKAVTDQTYKKREDDIINLERSLYYTIGNCIFNDKRVSQTAPSFNYNDLGEPVIVWVYGKNIVKLIKKGHGDIVIGTDYRLNILWTVYGTSLDTVYHYRHIQSKIETLFEEYEAITKYRNKRRFKQRFIGWFMDRF